MPSFSWNLDNTYYDYVKNSQKIYEIRVLDDKRKLINVGDSIIFNNRDNIQRPLLSTKVSEIKIYGDFKEALEDTPLSEVLPNVETIDEGIKIYESFPHGEETYKEASEKYGVVRFKFSKVMLI